MSFKFCSKTILAGLISPTNEYLFNSETTVLHLVFSGESIYKISDQLGFGKNNDLICSITST